MNNFKFEFGRRQINKISRDKVIAELEKVAKHFDYTDFKQDEFNQIADISYFTVYRELGSWDKVMEFLVNHFKRKGIIFRITTRRSSYSIQEMFDEMERVWVLLGHRPSRNEWVAAKPKISYDSIYRRFGGWTNACLKFIEYKSGEEIKMTGAVEPVRLAGQGKGSASKNEQDKTTKIIEKARTIPLSLRVKVLSRDNFRCAFCGKSPATDIGTKLHVDHILPFSKGGQNTLENLQVLCEECNLGKSDQNIK